MDSMFKTALVSFAMTTLGLLAATPLAQAPAARASMTAVSSVDAAK